MKKTLKVLHAVLDTVLAVALVLSISLIILTTFTPVKTLSIYKVVSGSMEPAIHVGSVVISKSTNPAGIKKNDIISYTELNNPGTIVTHRVADIKTEDSKLIFTTKGDANNIADPDAIAADRIKGKVLFTIPLLGYLLVWVKQPLGFLITIVFPALFIIISEIFAMKKTIEENAVNKFKKKQEERVSKIITLILAFSLFSSLAFLDPGKTLSFFSSGKVLGDNIFSTGCWAPPSVPELIYPENNSTALKGSEWDKNPYMDWNDSTTECPAKDLKITYIYESYTDKDLKKLAYVSQPLDDSRIPAPGTPDNTYWWRVKACDSFGRCSKFSNPFVFTYDTSVHEDIVAPAAANLFTIEGAADGNALAGSSDPSVDTGSDPALDLIMDTSPDPTLDVSSGPDTDLTTGSSPDSQIDTGASGDSTDNSTTDPPAVPDPVIPDTVNESTESL